jgi:hypothetical protein
MFAYGEGRAYMLHASASHTIELLDVSESSGGVFMFLFFFGVDRVL